MTSLVNKVYSTDEGNTVGPVISQIGLQHLHP